MGARSSLLAFIDGDAAAVLRSAPPLDRDAAGEVLARMHPGARITPVADGTLGDDISPKEFSYVGAFPGLTVVCAPYLAPDRPSGIPSGWRRGAPAQTVLLHAQHSVVDWFAYAVWDAEGRLRRALSLAPDDGVVEDVGARPAYEQPYWDGAHPVEEELSGRPYPLPFHPLELAERVLREYLGFEQEGEIRPDDPEPFDVPLAGFLVEPAP
jgi:hypothetical protein